MRKKIFSWFRLMKHTLRPLSFFGFVALMVSIPSSAWAAACHDGPTCYPLSTGEIACICQPHWIPVVFWQGGSFGQVLFDPADPNTIYAALDRDGIYKSSNGRYEWIFVGDRLSDRRVSAASCAWMASG